MSDGPMKLELMLAISFLIGFCMALLVPVK